MWIEATSHLPRTGGEEPIEVIAIAQGIAAPLRGVLAEPLPQVMLDLLHALEQAEAARREPALTQ